MHWFFVHFFCMFCSCLHWQLYPYVLFSCIHCSCMHCSCMHCSFIAQFLCQVVCTQRLENPEETQVIIGSMNIGYGIYITARNRTHNLFCPKCTSIPLGHSGILSLYALLLHALLMHVSVCSAPVCSAICIYMLIMEHHPCSWIIVFHLRWFCFSGDSLGWIWVLLRKFIRFLCNSCNLSYAYLLCGPCMNYSLGHAWPPPWAMHDLFFGPCMTCSLGLAWPAPWAMHDLLGTCMTFSLDHAWPAPWALHDLLLWALQGLHQGPCMTYPWAMMPDNTMSSHVRLKWFEHVNHMNKVLRFALTDVNMEGWS